MDNLSWASTWSAWHAAICRFLPWGQWNDKEGQQQPLEGQWQQSSGSAWDPFAIVWLDVIAYVAAAVSYYISFVLCTNCLSCVWLHHMHIHMQSCACWWHVSYHTHTSTQHIIRGLHNVVTSYGWGLNCFLFIAFCLHHQRTCAICICSWWAQSRAT